MLEIKRDFNNWDEVFKYLVEKSHSQQTANPDIAVPASKLPSPKFVNKFNSAHRKSFKLGSDYVFRDNRTEESLQVRVYEDGKPSERFGELSEHIDETVYVVQLNQFNPQKGVFESVAHLYEDVLKLPNPFADYNQN